MIGCSLRKMPNRLGWGYGLTKILCHLGSGEKVNGTVAIRRTQEVNILLSGKVTTAMSRAMYFTLLPVVIITARTVWKFFHLEIKLLLQAIALAVSVPQSFYFRIPRK